MIDFLEQVMFVFGVHCEFLGFLDGWLKFKLVVFSFKVDCFQNNCYPRRIELFFQFW